MDWFSVSNLDYIAVKLEGMAIRFIDNGEEHTGYEFKRIAQQLKDISKDLREEQRIGSPSVLEEKNNGATSFDELEHEFYTDKEIEESNKRVEDIQKKIDGGME